MRFYHDQMGLSIVNVQAQERFTQALSGLVEPDDKRRAIGQTLQAVMDETLAGMGEFAVILAQHHLRRCAAGREPCQQAWTACGTAGG